MWLGHFITFVFCINHPLVGVKVILEIIVSISASLNFSKALTVMQIVSTDANIFAIQRCFCSLPVCTMADKEAQTLIPPFLIVVLSRGE